MLLRKMRGFLALIFILCSADLFAVSLSDSSRISLLTCAPGEELYSCFGHSGIRVTDYRQGFDVVFNYGTFDFGAPNFYLNFLRGHMIYMIGVDNFKDFHDQYIYEQRSIYEQEMNLDERDRAKIFDFLVNNARPENRDYRYDFLYDNCATRIRDVFEKNLPGKVKFDYSSFTDKKSFRTLINDYSENQPWEQFGMGLLIGLPVDRIATPEQETFLPDYLSQAFAHATVSGQPLCQSQVTILDIKAPSVQSLDKRITPNIVFNVLMLLVLFMTAWELRKGVHFYLVDFPLLFIAGILGCLMLGLGGFTEHTTTQWNLNLLWALPTHLIVAFLLPFMNKKKWISTYFLVTAVFAVIMVFGWKLLPQKFLYANICIAAIYGLRAYSIYKASKRTV
jgi:hypothetical protein